MSGRNRTPNGNKEVAQNPQGGTATLESEPGLNGTSLHTDTPLAGSVPHDGNVMPMPVVDPLLRAVSFLRDKDSAQESIASALLADYKLTTGRLSQIEDALTKMGMSLPGAGRVVNPLPVAAVGGKKRGPKKGWKTRLQTKSAPQSSVSDDEDGNTVRAGSNSALVLSLVQKYAPGRKEAKTKAEIRALGLKDAKFKSLTDDRLNTGLQANRPPKVKIPRIGLIGNKNGSPRGGRYYAMV